MVISKSHDKTCLIYGVYDFPQTLTFSKQFHEKFTEKLHFWVELLKSELLQNWKTEKNFKYVATICMHRSIMHIGLVILASIV